MAKFKPLRGNGYSIVKWVFILALIYTIFHVTSGASGAGCGCCANEGSDSAIEGFADLGDAGLGHDIAGSSTFSSLGNGVVDIRYPDVPPSGDTLDMLTGQTFRPDCCPSTYSNSSGCACMSDAQLDFLSSRGGNGNK
jgi:hypothetical protein